MALALAAVLGTSAYAQTASPGDVLIGFDQQNGVATNDYVVDLGPVTQFTNATSPLTFSLSASDLSNTFGSTWASNSQTNLVQWGVIGASNTTGTLTLGSTTFVANTLFYTVGELTPGTQSTAPLDKSSSGQNGINGNITKNFENGSGGFDGSAETAGSTSALQAVDQTHGATNSWDYEISTKGDFGIGTNIQQPLSGTGTGPTDSVLDLYESVPGSTTTPATYLGDFSLGSNGTLTFDSAAAIPEPSTYSLLGLGAMFLIWNLRRKKASLQV